MVKGRKTVVVVVVCVTVVTPASQDVMIAVHYCLSLFCLFIHRMTVT